MIISSDTSNNTKMVTSTLLLRLEYTLDKLHDIMLEAEILNNDVEGDVHSQCEYVIDLLPRIYNNSHGDDKSNYADDGNLVSSTDTRLTGLVYKYINIFDSYRQVYKDVDNLLQLFEKYISNKTENTDNNNNNNSNKDTPSLIKKVRFDDNNIGTTKPSIINKDNTEVTVRPYHDNVVEDNDNKNNNSSNNSILIDSSHEQPFDFDLQKSVLQSQDIQLDTLSRSVTLANSISRQMGDEIESQNDQLLTDLEANLDHNQRRINRIMNHKILKNKHKEQDRLCLVILILILTLLFLLIVL